MTPLILRRDSLIIRWAYQDKRAPDRVSVCAIFWRSVLFMPLVWLAIIASLPISGPMMLWEKYGQTPFRQWRYQRRIRRWERRRALMDQRLDLTSARTPTTPAWRVLWAGLKAVKGKVCPLIELSETPDLQSGQADVRGTRIDG